MNIIKRNGSEAIFDGGKIKACLKKANASVPAENRITDGMIDGIVSGVTGRCEGLGRAPSVEEVRDYVEEALQSLGAYVLSRHYIRYRHARELARQANTTDDRILSLVEVNNEEVKQENANKNPSVVSVQRDYIAGETSKDISRRILLPPDVVAAHDEI